MLGVQAADVGGHSFGHGGAGRLVGVGGQLLELGGDGVGGRGPKHVPVGTHPLRSEDAGHHDDERAVGVGHLGLGGRRCDVGRQVGRCGLAQDHAQFDAGALETFDGGGQLGVQSAQGLFRVVVAVAHGGDLLQGEA
ncbi:hypothetical protein ACFQY7_28545 [Actinomadura luteofluorescens]|uniref:hypothetical protein n=1 Tax=Actinomadura luteofluorescens TaxID=46163 RepID=UPI0036314498